MAVYVILLILILLFGAIILIHIKLHINALYQKNNEENQINITIMLSVLDKWEKNYEINYNFETWVLIKDVLLKKDTSSLQNQEAGMDFLLRQILRVLAVKIQNPSKVKDSKSFSYLFKSIKIDDLNWKTQIGNADYMLTGIYTGTAWAIKGALLSVLSHKISLLKIQLQVIPNFGQTILESRINCIAELKIVHIIIISILALYLKIRGWIHGTTGTK